MMPACASPVRHAFITFVAAAAAAILWSAEVPAQRGPLHVLDIRSAADLRDFFRYEPDGPPLVTSHRGGARSGFPENAIETFENTLRHTWSSLEVDPRQTKDGAVVLFHDPTLERTSTGAGRVVDHTWDELRRLKLKDPDGKVTEYRIPTLDDALAWANGKTVLFLDQKDVDVLDRARAIQRRDARAWAVVMAYTLEDARRLHAFDPEILMQVFLADSDAIQRFEASGVPWGSIVGFVTHTAPREPDIFTRIAAKGRMGVLGTSRTIDRAFAAGEIDRATMLSRYRDALASGAHVVEADLGIEAGEALEPLRAGARAKRRYFRME
jgi:glycerophosphoryl diester phosphodiesterase